MRATPWAVGLLLCLAVPLGAEDAPPNRIEERWDFYFARINDASASVMLNMALKAHAPITSEPTLLYVLLEMKDPDKHRMGSAAEMKRMQKIERDVTEKLAAAMKARNVARIRGEGYWQLYYYAPDDKGLESHVKKALARHAGQSFQAGSKPDPKWAYFEDFLWPRPERLRWMKDRQVVDQLQESGDVLVAARDVEHFAYFPDAAKSAAFEKKIVEKKFIVDERVELQDDKLPFLVRFHRKDKVELEHIHAVTEFLRKTATALGGTYDGWGTAVVTKMPAAEKKKDEKGKDEK